MIFNMNISNGSTAELNLSFETYASKGAMPTTAVENTIGIITNVAVTSYALSPTQPTSPTNGMVWISTSKATSYTLNVLKKNSIVVYLGNTKQYVNNAWVDVTALVYQNKQWKTFNSVSSLVLLFDAGNQYSDITGGWTINGYTCGSYPLQNGEMNSTSMYVYASYGNPGAVYSIAGTMNKIDISNMDTLKANIEISHSTGMVLMGIFSNKDVASPVAKSQSVYTIANHTLSVDVSGYSGEYYVAIYAYGSEAYGHDPVVSITKVWGE